MVSVRYMGKSHRFQFGDVVLEKGNYDKPVRAEEVGNLPKHIIDKYSADGHVFVETDTAKSELAHDTVGDVPEVPTPVVVEQAPADARVSSRRG